MIRCKNGHYYDGDKYRECPYCGIKNEDLQRTIAKYADTQNRKAVESDSAVTVAVSVKATGIDPVVGWLVCLNGTDKGKDYRLHSERNFIGRAENMDVALLHDSTVSRENHAILSFNPKNGSFRILAGDSRGLVYLNSEEVLTPQELKPYDIIELGESKLLFLPLCGTEFSWDKKDD